MEGAMSPHELLSSEQLSAVHERTMESVAECLRRTAKALSESSRLIHDSNKSLKKAPVRPGVSRE
jgi:hypothetical protein